MTIRGGRTPTRWAEGAVATAGVAAAVVASLTRPFTDGADLLVSIALASLLVVVWRQDQLASTLPVLARRRATHAAPRATAARQLPWAAVLAVTTGWELFCVASSPRPSHPTLSSMLDAADSTRPGRAIAFALWLALGWFLVTR